MTLLKQHRLTVGPLKYQRLGLAGASLALSISVSPEKALPQIGHVVHLGHLDRLGRFDRLNLGLLREQRGRVALSCIAFLGRVKMASLVPAIM